MVNIEQIDLIKKANAAFKDSLFHPFAGFTANSTYVRNDGIGALTKRNRLNKFVNDIRYSDPLLMGFSLKIDFYNSPLFRTMGVFDRGDIDYSDNGAFTAAKILVEIEDSLSKFDKLSETSFTSVGPISGVHERRVFDEMYGAIEYLYLSDSWKLKKDKPQEDNNTGNKKNQQNIEDLIDRLRAEKTDKEKMIVTDNEKIADYEQRLEEEYQNEKKKVIKNLMNAMKSKRNGEPSPKSSMVIYYESELDRLYDEVARYSSDIPVLESEILRLEIMRESEIRQYENTRPSININPYQEPIYPAPTSCMNLIRAYKILKTYNDQKQFMFRRITGMENVIKDYYAVDKAEAIERTFSIDIMEDVKMDTIRMLTSLSEAITDTYYKRERIPTNLQKFNMSIYVYDLRSFRNALTITGRNLIEFTGNSENNSRKPVVQESDKSQINQYLLKLASEHISVLELYFTGCRMKDFQFGGINELNSETVPNASPNHTVNFVYDTVDVNPVMFEDLNSLFGIIHSEVQ